MSTNTEVFLEERAMIVAKALPLWKSLCETIRQSVIERNLRESAPAPGVDQLIINSRNGHMVLTWDTVPSVQFEIYRTRRQEIEEAEIRGALTLEAASERVWLTNPEGERMSAAQAAGYLLDLLVSIDRHDF